MRHTILGSVSALALLASPVVAQDVTITEDRETPVDTATIDNGGPANITIDGATISPASGTAVTLNSSNQVTNSGVIEIQDANDSIGVLVLGGNTGGLTNDGAINLIEDFTQEDPGR